MFRYPEGPQPTSVAAPKLGERARLILEVPHWTTVVTIVDNDLRPVEGLSKLERLASGEDAASATVELPAGAYSVEARLGGHTQTMWVVAQKGHETRVPAAAWDGLTLATSMPIASAIDGTPPSDPLVGEVERLSLESAPAPALNPVGPANARLFLFGRLADAPDKTTSAAWDIQLIDANGAMAVNLLDHGPVQGDFFWSFTYDLPKGYYVLRARETSERSSYYRCQPLYLCGGWESHVFLECYTSPLLATMSFNMSRIGVGFRPNDDATIAAASMLAALANDDAIRTLIGASPMEVLLRGEMDNPWLGVLAAYVLSSVEAPSDSNGLLAEVKQFLLREMADHPDVRALTLAESGHLPLDYPPMLRAGLHLIRANAANSSSTIVTDSVLSKVGQRLVADSAWTAWMEQDERTAVQPTGDAPESETASGQVLVEGLPSSAAVYPLSSQGDEPGPGRPKSLAEHVAIIEAAETVLNAPDGEAPAALTLPMGDSVETLLQVDRDTVKRFAGAGLEMVDEGFSRLSDRLEHLETPDNASTRAIQGVLAAAFEAKRCASIAEIAQDPGQASDRAWWFSTPIEDHVDRLRQEAQRMRALASEKSSLTPKEAKESEKLAGRLDGLAERLTSCAQIVIIADEDGRLLYGNKLLHERLQHREDPDDVLKRLHKSLGRQSVHHVQVSAAELSPTSPEGRRGAMIDIHRTVVHGAHDEVEAYIYLLRAADAKNLGPDEASRLDTLLPTITLHAATAQHGVSGASASLAALSDLTDELERILA